VPTRIYDETIEALKSSVAKAKLGDNDKNEAIKKLTKLAQKAEQNFTPHEDKEGSFNKILEQERTNSWKYGGRTVKGFVEKPKPPNDQLSLF
jgi:uncharacterized protein